MTPERRAEIIALLEDSAGKFREAVAEVPETAAHASPGPDRWSPVEIVEHVGLAETGMFRLLNAAKPVEGSLEDREREARLYARVLSRVVPGEAPDRAKPFGRCATLDDAVEQFGAARAKTLRYVGETATDLFSVVAAHPLFGNLNGYELLVVMAGHPLRHAAQIREAIR